MSADGPPPVTPSRSARHARELVEELLQFGDSEFLTEEEARAINGMFAEFTEQGEAAIPAIRAFLRRRTDVNFDDMDGGDLVAHGSVRLALLDVLGQIGGDRANDVVREQLRATKDPVEIALLALSLEQENPGEYREEIVSAARGALRWAGRLPPEERTDVSPLFELLQTYGGADVVVDLEDGMPGWWQYSLLALAALPNGEGVPSLVGETMMPGIPVDSRAPLPFQMLAQASIESPDAAEALATLAREGGIPDRAWNSIGSALRGMHLTLPLQLNDAGAGTPAAEVPVLGEYTTDDTRYELRLASAGWSEEQIHQQLELIDVLLDATNSPGAVTALREARGSLHGALPR
jgi:hypothetical protein